MRTADSGAIRRLQSSSEATRYLERRSADCAHRKNRTIVLLPEGRQHLGMCKNSNAVLHLDSFAFVTSLQKRTAETPGSQGFPLQHFSDTLTTVHICRVARGACVQRSVDRNLFRSSRGARHSQEYSTLFIRFNLCENCYNRALRLLRLCGEMTFLQEARLLHRSVCLKRKFV